MIVGANMPWQYIDTESGLIMPWYTLPTLEWLKKQDTEEWHVFEFGCGYSTIWWRLNAESVVFVDHNAFWADAIGGLDRNAWSEPEKEDYIRICEVTRPLPLWDCIVIDGVWRFECLQAVINQVKKGGYIIIDNWGQEDFPNTKEAEELLVGWEKQIFKQPNHSRWVTAVFQRP